MKNRVLASLYTIAMGITMAALIAPQRWIWR